MIETKKQILKEITLFLILLCLLSAGPYTLMISSGSMMPYVALLVFCPALAAIFTRLIYRRNLRGLGWGLGQKALLPAGYLIPLAAALVVYVTVWVRGLGKFSVEAFTAGYAQISELEAPLSPLGSLFMVLTVSFLLSLVFSLGEEIGWRGLFAPAMMKLTGYTGTSLITGAVWIAWHFPAILFTNYNAGTHPVYALICFSIMAMAVGFILTWLRLKSGSLWPAVILHAAHNTFIQNLFDTSTVDLGGTKLITTEFGFGLALVYAILAFYFWTQRRRLPE